MKNISKPSSLELAYCGCNKIYWSPACVHLFPSKMNRTTVCIKKSVLIWQTCFKICFFQKFVCLLLSFVFCFVCVCLLTVLQFSHLFPSFYHRISNLVCQKVHKTKDVCLDIFVTCKAIIKPTFAAIQNKILHIILCFCSICFCTVASVE